MSPINLAVIMLSVDMCEGATSIKQRHAQNATKMMLVIPMLSWMDIAYMQSPTKNSPCANRSSGRRFVAISKKRHRMNVE